jgi:hypothetical protein
VPVPPDTPSGGSSTSVPNWSSTSFPVARPNPYDVPGDPNASMVGIAPRAPRVRAAMTRQRVFTDDDLLETRGSGWSTPPTPEPVRSQAPEDAADDVDDTQRDAANAARQLEGARRRN